MSNFENVGEFSTAKFLEMNSAFLELSPKIDFLLPDIL